MISKKLLLRVRAKRNLLVLTSVFLLMFGLFIQSCKKDNSPVTPAGGGQAGPGETEENLKKRKPGTEPPPPEQFYFYCVVAEMSGSLKAGKPANVTIQLNYMNGSGGTYSAFTSTTINGITLSTPAGTLNSGSGSIIFTASGTPVNTGFFHIPISINGSPTCPLTLTVSNAPVSGPTADPGLTPGSTGI